MADFSRILDVTKKAALGAVDASNPTQLMYGKVVSENPIKIDVEQKLTLEKAQLILTRNVTDYYVDMTVSHKTEQETAHTHPISDTYTGGGSSSPTQHAHDYTGKKRFKVHNALKEGELVVLLRVQGGQQFIVWDRLENSSDDTDGQWGS